MAKINRALRRGGRLILTTPNIASLFRRLRLLLGRQPIYRYHVREYTMGEVLSIVREAGFDVVKAYFSAVNDVSLVEANYPVLSYWDLIKATARRPTQVNVLRALVYPVVRLIPGLRQLIVVAAEKLREPDVRVVERWG